jgi:hypothetical protein
MGEPLAAHAIRGISSMIRDLGMLTSDSGALEREVIAAPPALSPEFFLDLELAATLEQDAQVGDVVLFRLRTAGAYQDMETLWGDRVPLTPGASYLGVLCNRGSTKLITGELPEGIREWRKADMQFIAQAGGIGRTTGYSPALAKESGTGVASDVDVLGSVRDRSSGQLLNTVQALEGARPPGTVALPPIVLVVGTATDVGKTTAAKAILHEVSRYRRCAALKASGTGWYEDSLLHAEGGAFPSLNFTFAGLPTTYGVPPARYVAAMGMLFGFLADPSTMPDWFVKPDQRAWPREPPELVVIEHGGDLIWGNIPAFLGSATLMQNVRVILVCCESVLALLGALGELAQVGLRNGTGTRMFAAMPLMNPEACYQRLAPVIERGELAGVVDISKPVIAGARARRSGYAEHYERVLACADLVEVIEEVLAQGCTTTTAVPIPLRTRKEASSVPQRNSR